MGYTLAVFGQASLNKNLIFDTLADHLRLGPIDDEGYYTASSSDRFQDVHLVIAVENAEGAEALDPLNEWSARADLTYTLLTRTGFKPENLIKDANRIVTSDDVPGRLAELLREVRGFGHEAALALACDPNGPDEKCWRLIHALTGTSIGVYSIGDGLLPFSAAYIPDAQPEPQPVAPLADDNVAFTDGNGLMDLHGFLDAIDDAANEALADAKLGRDRLTKLTAELRGALARPGITLPNEAFDQLVETLDAPPKVVPELVKLFDVAEGRVPMLDLEHGPMPPDPEPVSFEPKAIEVQSTKPTKVKREWLDPSDNTWKPIGRGRPRKDVQIREVEA